MFIIISIFTVGKLVSSSNAAA